MDSLPSGEVKVVRSRPGCTVHPAGNRTVYSFQAELSKSSSTGAGMGVGVGITVGAGCCLVYFLFLSAQS